MLKSSLDIFRFLNMRIVKKKMSVITIVSGLPRSGTSVMMQMLEAGGMKVVVDNIRKADKENPKGTDSISE